MPAELRLLVLRLGLNRVPEYHTKRASRPGCGEWYSSVSLYHNDQLLAIHTGQAFKSTRVEAVADAAWESIISICYSHYHELQVSWYKFYPHRRSGTGNFSVAIKWWELA